MLAQSLSKRTIDERLRVIGQFQEHTGVPACSAGSDHITIWLSTLPSTATKHAYFLNLRAWFHFLVLTDNRQDDPTTRVFAPKRPKYAPRPLMELQVKAALETTMRHHARTRILFAAFAGLRVHEIAKISGQDLDRVTGLLRIQGKGGRTDLVPLHPALLADAQQYPNRGYWFPSDHPRGFIGTEAVRTSITRVFDRVGVTMTPHQLRHYFATALLAGGVDARIVQTLMRHESLATTAIYMAVGIEQQQSALQQLDLPGFFKNIL